MNVRHYSHGIYSINRGISYHKSIEEWIQEKLFLKCEEDNLRLNKKSRKRNKLYCFHSEYSNCNLIMKVSQVSKEYKFWRKVDLYITSLFKDYNYNSYRSSIKLQAAGIDTVKPIAYWTYGLSWLNRKSYFLYEKVESDITVTELCNNISASSLTNRNELVGAITQRCMDIVKNIHAANIRHDDPHGGNILTNLEIAENLNIDANDVNNSRFILIDNDRCTTTYNTISIIKQFFDLKCLTRFNICNISNKNLLQLYLGNEYNIFWWYIFMFWKSGGFNIKKRINILFANTSD